MMVSLHVNRKKPAGCGGETSNLVGLYTLYLDINLQKIQYKETGWSKHMCSSDNGLELILRSNMQTFLHFFDSSIKVVDNNAVKIVYYSCFLGLKWFNAILHNPVIIISQLNTVTLLCFVPRLLLLKMKYQFQGILTC